MPQPCHRSLQNNDNVSGMKDKLKQQRLLQGSAQRLQAIFDGIAIRAKPSFHDDRPTPALLPGLLQVAERARPPFRVCSALKQPLTRSPTHGPHPQIRAPGLKSLTLQPISPSPKRATQGKPHLAAAAAPRSRRAPLHCSPGQGRHRPGSLQAFRSCAQPKLLSRSDEDYEHCGMLRLGHVSHLRV